MWKHNNTAAICVTTSRQHRGILGGRGRGAGVVGEEGEGRKRKKKSGASSFTAAT